MTARTVKIVHRDKQHLRLGAAGEGRVDLFKRTDGKFQCVMPNKDWFPCARAGIATKWVRHEDTNIFVSA